MQASFPRKESVRPAEVLAAACVVALFAAMACAWFSAPGRVWDGLRNASFGLRVAERLAAGDFARAFGGYPLYHGNLHGYLMAPFFALWGPSWTVVKLSPVLFGALAMLFTYLFARNVFGRRAALLTVALWAMHPAFLMLTKMAQDNISTSGFFTMGTLFFAERWWRTGRRRFLFLAGLWTGLGFGTFLWFLWFVLAAGAAAVVFHRGVRRRLGDSRPAVLGNALAAGLGLLPGLAPIWIYERAHDFESLQRFLVRRDFAEVMPAVPFAEALLRFGDALSSGVYFTALFAPLPAASLGNAVFPWAVLAAIAWLLRLAASRAEPDRRPIGLLLILVGGIVAQMLLSSLRQGLEFKLAFLLPFPQLLIAVAVSKALERPGRLPKAAALAVLCAAAAGEIRGLHGYFGLTAKYGGLRRFTPAIYDVAAWVRENVPDGETVVSDYITPHNLKLLLPGKRLDLVSVNGLSLTRIAVPIAQHRLEAARLADGRDFYVIRDCWTGKDDLSTLWPEKSFVLLRRFPDRDGVDVMEAYRAGPPAVSPSGPH